MPRRYREVASSAGRESKRGRRSRRHPIVLGGDHTIALPDVTGVARHVGWGRVSVIHFDAHADTGDTQMGSLYGHGTPMRRLIESGPVAVTASCRSDCAATGPNRRHWRGWPSRDALIRDERDRVARLDDVLHEAIAIATSDCDAVFCRSTSTSSTRARLPDRHARTGRADESPTARRRTPNRDGDHVVASTSSKSPRRTITPRSRPIWATASCSRRWRIAWRRKSQRAKRTNAHDPCWKALVLIDSRI